MMILHVAIAAPCPPNKDSPNVLDQTLKLLSPPTGGPLFPLERAISHWVWEACVVWRTRVMVLMKRQFNMFSGFEFKCSLICFLTASPFTRTVDESALYVHFLPGFLSMACRPTELLVLLTSPTNQSWVERL